LNKGGEWVERMVVDGREKPVLLSPALAKVEDRPKPRSTQFQAKQKIKKEGKERLACERGCWDAKVCTEKISD